MLASLLIAVALSTSPYGVNAHIPSEAALDGAQAAGLEWVRYDFNWFQIESARGVYDWTAQDAAVDAAVARGLSVYVTLAYTPQWASSNPSCITDGADAATRCQTQTFNDVGTWTEFVTAAVTRYQDRVKVFGMWNEPNLGEFFSGTQAQYIDDILVPGSAAVHAACADCLVAGPETAGLTASSRWNGANGVCAFGGCIRNGWELDLGGVLDAAGDSIDVITQHFYNSNAQTEAVGQLCDGEFFGTTMTHDSLRGVLAGHGGASKPIWLTETGMESGSNEAAQSAFLTALLDARAQLLAGTYAPAVNDPFTITRIFLYDLQDGAGDSWGLLHADGSPKQAYTDVAAWIAAHPDPAPTASPTATPGATATPGSTATPGPTAQPSGTPGSAANGGHGGCDVATTASPLGAMGALFALGLAVRARRSRSR